jgi:hypothetical protein
MADISGITLRKYGPTDTHFNYLRANEPLEDLYAMIKMMNEHLDRLDAEIRTARGTRSTLDDRISESLDPDGSIASGAVTNVPIANVIEEETVPYDPEDKVHATRGMVDKLAAIAERANRFLMAVNRSDAMEGETVLRTGSLLRASMVTDNDGRNILKLDTVFSPDAIHAHRMGVRVNSYTNAIALIPEDEDPPIAGTIIVHLNGTKLRASAYEEYYDSAGILRGVRILESASTISLQVDDLELDYLVRAVPANQDIQGDTLSILFDHDVEAVDSRPIYLPEGSVVGQDFYYQLFDISGVQGDLSGSKLFVSEVPWVGVSSPAIHGLTLRRYAEDWDVVIVGGKKFLRWRYQADTQLSNDPSQVAKYANAKFLYEDGAGTPEVPETRRPKAAIDVGSRLILFR